MKVKKIFAKVHLWLSVPFGIFISILCISGALLVFQDEIIRMQHSRIYYAEHHEDTNPLPASQLIERVKGQLPAKARITGIRIFSDQDRTTLIYCSGGGVHNCYANPYTGQVTGSEEPSAFFNTVLRLHRFLLNPFKDSGIPWGKRIVGISTLLLVFILLSGLVIWFPKKRKQLSARLKIKANGSRFRFWYDLHVAGGFYIFIFLLGMALTGLTWSFDWYRESFYGLLGGNGEMPEDMAKASAERLKEVRKINKGRKVDYLQWDKVLADLGKRYPHFKDITIRKDKASVTGTHWGNAAAKDNFTFNLSNGSIISEALYANSPAKARISGWIWSIHTGAWGGIFSKIIYLTATLMGAVLVFTGYYIWLKKKCTKKHKR